MTTDEKVAFLVKVTAGSGRGFWKAVGTVFKSPKKLPTGKMSTVWGRAKNVGRAFPYQTAALGAGGVLVGSKLLGEKRTNITSL